jgi:hypothetical protein
VSERSDLETRLGAARQQGTLRLTTRGRRTGRPHTVPVWFAVENTVLYLATLNAERDWVRNAGRTPEVDLHLGDLRLHGRIEQITDRTLDAHVRQLLAQKYWFAWLGSWLGLGPDRTFRVDHLDLDRPTGGA